MIALFPALFTALYAALFVATLWAARHAADRIAPRITAGWRWWVPSLAVLALTAALARPSNPIELFALVAGLGGWLMLNAAVELRRPGGRVQLAWAQLYVGLIALMAGQLAGQDYFSEAQGLEARFTWVLRELLGIFTLPWVSWLAPSWAEPRLIGEMYAAATQTLFSELPLLLAAGLHGFAWLAVATLAPTRAPRPGIALLPRSRWSLLVLPFGLFVGLIADHPTSSAFDVFIGEAAYAIVVPVYAAQGILLTHQLARPLRARTGIALLLLACFPFLPFVITFLVSLGFLDHLVALRRFGTAPAPTAPLEPAAVLKGGLVAAVAIAVLAVPGALANTSQGPPFESTPDCSGVSATPEAGRVRYTAGASSFAIDVDESSFEAGADTTHAAAQAACRARGARLCTSAEFDRACYCGYKEAIAGGRQFQSSLIATCFGEEGEGWSTSHCSSADGVTNLLSGRVELLADAERSGAHLIAGATLFVGGGWNLYCGYRSRAVDGPLQQGAWPWVGYRCCTD